MTQSVPFGTRQRFSTPPITAVALLLVAAMLVATPAMAARNSKGKKKAAKKPQVVLRLGEYRQLIVARTAALATKFKAEFERARNAALETMAFQQYEIAKKDFDDCQSKLTAVSDERKEIEQSLIETGSSNPEFYLARRQFESRRDTLRKQRKKVEASGGSLKSDEKYQSVLLAYRAAHQIYGRLKHDLFSADQRWKDNVEVAQTLKEELKVAAEKMESSASLKLRASSQRQLADKSAARANATIQHAESRGVTAKSKPR